MAGGRRQRKSGRKRGAPVSADAAATLRRASAAGSRTYDDRVLNDTHHRLEKLLEFFSDADVRRFYKYWTDINARARQDPPWSAST